MVAEIKVLGPIIRARCGTPLTPDVERMSAIQDGELERYMILVIPNSKVQSSLGQHLSGVCYSPLCVERKYPEFGLRLWRLEASPNQPLQQTGGA